MNKTEVGGAGNTHLPGFLSQGEEGSACEQPYASHEYSCKPDFNVCQNIPSGSRCGKE